MNKNILHILCAAVLTLLPAAASAQNSGNLPAKGKAATVIAPTGGISVSANGGTTIVPLLSTSSSYTLTPQWAEGQTPWFTISERKPGSWKIKADYWYSTEPRTGEILVTMADGTTKTLTFEQRGNAAINSIKGDTQIPVKSAKASEQNSSNEGIAKTYDGNYGSYYHSVWNGSSTRFPVTLTYTFVNAPHIDYLTYIPRSDSGNGRFGKVTVEYSTTDAPTTWVKVADQKDFGFSEQPTSVKLGENGADKVHSVRLTVHTGQNNFVSCAEMEFYKSEQTTNTLFTDALCSELKPGITDADIALCTDPFARQLASYIRNTNYSTEFRVGTFQCYERRETVQQRMKTSNAYDFYENPTGIYFEKGEKIAVFADGISDQHPVSICIKCFSNQADIEAEGQPESFYNLHNGINVIEAQNRGNAYVFYFSDDYANAPAVRLHFAMAYENGYFDASRHTNADYTRMIKTAKSDIFDILTQRMHMAAPMKNLKAKCPSNMEKLAKILDEVIYREHEIMGMHLFNDEPRNHQFARPVRSGMFADGLGAAAAFGSFDEWVNPSNFGFWGIAHELGHNNQITPGFKWSGCGETTNNIYASWVEHTVGAKTAYGVGHHRLEDEISGVNDYSGKRGGRFEAYLEEGVRKGVSWQLQDGPDYHGTKPNSVSVQGQDADGNSTGQVTTTSRNYDHFVKVIPFWQLNLWSKQAGAQPDGMSKFYHSYREGFNKQTYNTNGKQQMEMVRRMCDAMQTDLTDFFEKAGILKPINAYIEDYSKGWNIITEEMVEATKQYIQSKGYPKAPAALNYINAYNWENFRDKLVLAEGTLGTGCSAPSNNQVRVENSKWPGAVGYETYNSNGELIRITMYGLGDSQMSSRYTYVLFPSSEDAKFIMAVGYDGTKVKIYEK